MLFQEGFPDVSGLLNTKTPSASVKTVIVLSDVMDQVKMYASPWEDREPGMKLLDT